MKKKDFSNLHKHIIEKGLCTGCGTCIGVCPTQAIEFDFNLEEPVLKGLCVPCGICYSTCPGQDIPLLKLEKKFLGEHRTPENELLGVSKAFFKGFAKSPHIRQLGASGGLTTALLLYALDQGMINGAIVTTMNPEKPWRVKPLLARTRAELMEAAKSKYAISPSNMALRQTEGINRLAVVGLPCHVHGIRKLQSHGNLPRLAEKIVIVLGIFCGSNWPYKATEHLIQEYCDVNFEEIQRFEYRGGVNSQDVKIFTHDKKEITITTDERRTVFQAMAKDRCRMCCDWTAELADLSFGDIFDPRNSAMKIPNWNSAIVRTKNGLRFLEEAHRAGFIEISPLEETSFYGNIGFEIKKHGAVYNLMERSRCRLPTPKYRYKFAWQAKRKEFYGAPED